MSRLEMPDMPCPKCEQDDAFRTLEPRYRETTHYGGLGSLAWPCYRCGYEYVTPTADSGWSPPVPAEAVQ